MRVGDKLSIQGTELVSIDRSSLLTGIRRSIRGDAREALLTWIPQLVALTHEAFRQQHMTQYHERVLKQGITGLLTLRDTYSADVSFVSRLEVCLDKLRELEAAKDVPYFFEPGKKCDVDNEHGAAHPQPNAPKAGDQNVQKAHSKGQRGGGSGR